MLPFSFAIAGNSKEHHDSWTLLADLHGCVLQVKAISLLTETAKYCDDDTRLQRIVPYLVVRHHPSPPVSDST